MGLRFKKNNGTDYPKWKTYSLGEIYTDRNERGDSSLPILSVSIHTGVSCGELDEDAFGKRVKRSADKTLYKKVEAGDFVFNMMRAWQGGYGVAPVAGMVSPAYIVAKPNDLVNPMYMEYALRTKRMLSFFDRQSYGVMDFRKRLYWNSFTPIKCTLPCIEEQNRIIESLSTLDKLISSSEEEVNNLVEQKKAVMQKLFSQEFRFKKDDGNEYPRWEQKTIKEICEYSSSQISAGEKIENGEYMLFDANGCIGFSEKKLDMPYFSIIKDGSGVGNTRLLPKGTYCIGTMGMITSHNNDIGFVFYLFNTLNLSKFVVGGAIPHIYFKDYGNIISRVPCLEEQEKIASFLSSFDDAITAAKEELECWKDLKKGLLQQLFEQEEE